MKYRGRRLSITLCSVYKFCFPPRSIIQSHLSPAPVTFPPGTWLPEPTAGKYRADTKLCCRAADTRLMWWAVGNGVSAEVSLQIKAPCLPRVTMMQWICFKSGLQRCKHSVIISSSGRSFSLSSFVMCGGRFDFCSSSFIMAELMVRSSFRLGDMYAMLCHASLRKGFSAFMMHVGSNHTK